MNPDPKQREVADKILRSIEGRYGFIPLVNEVLSERPDIFIPAANLGRSVMEGGVIEPKMKYLMAVSAASALGGQHCIHVQMHHAIEAGASKDEVMEAIMVGAYMSMTRAQSYALREFKDAYKDAEPK